MLADIIQSWHASFVSVTHDSSTQVWVWLLALVVLHTTWRLWAFVIHPRLRSRAIAEVPYMIPFLGHTLAMFKDTASLVRHGMCYFGGSYEPFSIRLLGERIYVVSSPYDVATVYKDSTNFSWDAYMDRLLKAFGLSAKAREISWAKPSLVNQNRRMKTINPQFKSLVHLIEHIYKIQLLPGEQLDLLRHSILSMLDKNLTWANLNQRYVLEFGIEHRRISVKTLCAFLITDSTTRGMFGDLMFEYEPNLYNHMRTFNDDFWACVFNVPKIFTPRLNKARNVLCSAMRRYIRTPKELRQGGAWSIRAIVEAVDCFGMDEDSQVAMLFMIWWAAHSNTINACFWLVCNVAYNETLVDALLKETAPAFRGTAIDIPYLMNNCPLLDSAYLEVLRLVNGAFSIRKVQQDTEVSGRVLKAGNTLVIPYRELHSNPNVWGESTTRFEPERFLKQPKLAAHPSYRPFGGGVSYCPGRNLAKAEVCGFVAAFINRFQISVPLGSTGEPQAFPLLDTTKPSTGITGCMPDMDLYLDIKPRI